MMTQEYEELKAEMAEAYAADVRKARVGAQRCADRLSECEQALDGLAAVRYDGDGASGGGMAHGDDRLVERLTAVEQARESYADAMAGYLEAVQDWDARVSCLDERSQKVLDMRYVQGDRWEYIARRLNYSERMVFYLRVQSLVALYDVMPERYRLADESAV